MKESRRSFLGRAGAAAIVYKVAGAAPKLKAAGPNDQIALGFVGVGIRGTQLFQGFQSIPGVRIVIAADAYDGHLAHVREATGGKTETTRKYEDVLARKDIDAVVIATPDHWHKRLTIEALSAGKHVYIEKPLTWRIEEGREIIDAEARSGKIVQVGSGVKTAATTVKAKEIIQSGALGKVNMIRMENNRNNAEGAWVYPVPSDASPETVDWERFLGSAPKRPYDPKVFFRWRCWWEYSGGVTTDLFVHLLTGLHSMMAVRGPVSAVSQGGIYRWKDGRTVPDVMNSIFEYQEGFVADMYVNLANSRETSGTVIKGTEGTLVIGNRKMMLYPEPNFPEVQRYGSTGWAKATREKYYESLNCTPEGIPRVPPPAAKPAQEITLERLPQHHEYFIMSLRNGTPSVENATEGHYAAGAGHLANLAYRRGRRMRWNLDTFEVSEG